METVILALIGAAGGVIASVVTVVRVILDHRRGLRATEHEARREDRDADDRLIDRLEKRLTATESQVDELQHRLAATDRLLADEVRYTATLTAALIAHGIPVPARGTAI